MRNLENDPSHLALRMPRKPGNPYHQLLLTHVASWARLGFGIPVVGVRGRNGPLAQTGPALALRNPNKFATYFGTCAIGIGDGTAP
jgi:hypothetical protein